MKLAYIFLAEGFEEIEAVTPLDLLRRVGVDARFVSVTGSKHVTGAHGAVYQADLLFDEIETAADMFILPGGMPGTLHLQAHAALGQLLTDAFHAGKWVCAICAAPMVLGSLGILQGKTATIYPGMEEHLIGAAASTDTVCVDGNVVTSRAPGTAMPFALCLAELLTDAATAEALSGDLVWGR